MRVGIITYWTSSDNYGQQLQAYALQAVLKKIGHNPFLVRFVESTRQPLLERILRFVGSPRSIIYRLSSKGRHEAREARKKSHLAALWQEKNKAILRSLFPGLRQPGDTADILRGKHRQTAGRDGETNVPKIPQAP